MGENLVLGLRLVGFVELIVLTIALAIDAIDEKINAIDEGSIGGGLRRLLLEGLASQLRVRGFVFTFALLALRFPRLICSFGVHFCLFRPSGSSGS